MVKSAQTRAHHKKRFGKHQKHSRPFLKVYSPYLPLFLSIALSLVFTFGWGMSPRGNVQAASAEIDTSMLLEAANSQRVGRGKQALNLSSSLDHAAQAKANDMVARDYWSHNTPDGDMPWKFVEQAGYSYTKAGENLAYGFTNSKDVIVGWMNSQSHRSTLLDGQYKDVGFGFASSSNYSDDGPQTVVVALFGTTSAAVNDTSASSSDAVHVKSDTFYKLAASDQSKPKAISRVQLATGGMAPNITAAIILSAVAGLLFLSSKHALALRRLFTKGEVYIIKHPLLDVTIIAFLLACVALTRAAGIVR